MVSDMPAVGGDQDGYDVSSGAFVMNASALGQRIVATYQRAEQVRRQRLSEFMTAQAIPYTTISGSVHIRRNLVHMTEVFARAG